LQTAEPTSVAEECAEEFSHTTPLSPEAVLVDEIDKRSAESRQVRVENIPEVVNSSFTGRKEAQKCGSDDGVMEQTGGTVSSSLATVLVHLADHTPQVVMTQQCKPKARLLISAECLKILQEKEDKKKQQLEEKEQKQKSGAEKILREQETQRKKEVKVRKVQKKAEKALQNLSEQAKRNIQAKRQNPNK